MSKKVGFVPFPEVERYSDVITLGSVGFPSGFDEERLELHVGRLERAAYLGGIKSIILSSYRGDTTQYQAGFNETNGQALATAVFSSTATKAEIGQSEASDDELAHTDYKWRELGVKFNNAEIDQRLHDAPMGSLDASRRAKLMSSVIRRELIKDTVEHELSASHLVHEGLYRTFNFAMYIGVFNWSVPQTLVWSSTLTLFAYPIVGSVTIPDDRKDGEYKYSMFSAFRADRVALSAAHLIRPVIRGRD